MILFVLYVLASLDGALCGFRTGAGRCALIHTRRFNVRSMLRGFVVAQGACAAALVVLLLAFFTSGNAALLLADLDQAAVRMVEVFGGYAALVLVNLSLRLLPSVDIRSATSVMILGPLTALRPAVMVTGTIYGVGPSRLLTTKLLGGFVLALMLGLEWILNRMNDRIQERELSILVPLGTNARSIGTNP